MSQWVRLWEDMPNDPKWRVVARRAARPVGEVLAVFVHMMTNAGRAAERGALENWSDEDVAAALDFDPEHVSAIREAMQGKTLDGERLTGWERRQPRREDSSTGRVQAFRDRQRMDETPRNAPETQCNAPEEKRVETEKKDTSSLRSDVAPKARKSEGDPKSILETVLSPEIAAGVVEHRKKLRKPLTALAARGLAQQFADTGQPDRAATTMIERGWQGFKVEWFERDIAPPARAGPAGITRLGFGDIARMNPDFPHERSDPNHLPEAASGSNPPASGFAGPIPERSGADASGPLLDLRPAYAGGRG